MNDWNKHKNQETKTHACVPKWKVSTHSHNDLGGLQLKALGRDNLSSEFAQGEGVWHDGETLMKNIKENLTGIYKLGATWRLV